MSSNEVIKSVAKQLKYYFDIKRLEDGFDLSDVHVPQLGHPPLKVRSALQNGVLRDKPLKHHFSHPDVRVHLTQLGKNVKNGRAPLQSKREIQVRKLLKNYMKNYSFQEDCYYPKKKSTVSKSTLPSCDCFYQAKGCPNGLQTTCGLRRKKKPRNMIGGWPLLRSVPDQHVSKGEATRLVNSATKMLAATTNFGLYPGAVDYSLKYEPHMYKKNKPKKLITAKYSPKTSPKGRDKAKHQTQYTDSSDSESSKKSSDSDSRPPSPTPSQNTSRSSTSNESSHTKSSSISSSSHSSDTSLLSSPTSARFKSQTYITLPVSQPNEEVGVVQSTQTVANFDQPTVNVNTDKKEDVEVSDGPMGDYEVYVCTGDRLGASTKAPIKLIMFGEKGRTKEFILQNSKSHKIPFQKGKEDLFNISAHHIGQIKKIQIGHDRPELNFAWYLKGVTIYDMYAKRIFQFPCEHWLSGQDGDKKTYRILEVDRERDFMEAVETSMSKSPRAVGVIDSSASDSSDILVNGQRRKKLNQKKDAVNETSFNADGKILKDETPKKSHPLESKVKVIHSEYEEEASTGPIIRLHSANDNKQVDEIYINTHAKNTDSGGGKRHKIEREDEKENYSTEVDKRHQVERERAMESKILQGKSIHDAIRAGDLERVKDLINQFNEMKDFRDGNAWTPIHLAAARGNIDILRWLVTSDADINAVTPNGCNAMHIAAVYGHVNSMMVLQAMGCPITSLTQDKQSALHLAAKNGHLECIKWLVANRAPITQEDVNGKTAVQLAEDSGYETCAEFLNVCMKELTNPISSFYLINRNNHSDLPPVDEDAGFSETPKKNKHNSYYNSTKF